MNRGIGWGFATVVGLELFLAAGLCSMVWVLVTDPWNWIESKAEAHAREKKALENQVAALESQVVALETQVAIISNVWSLASDWGWHLEAFSNQLTGLLSNLEESASQKGLDAHFQNMESRLDRLGQDGREFSRQLASLPSHGDLSKLESDIRSLGYSVQCIQDDCSATKQGISAVRTNWLPAINRKILDIQTNWLPAINNNIFTLDSHVLSDQAINDWLAD